MDNKQIYLIGNAHLDPVWLWTRNEGYSEIKATFKSALDRMEEFGEYVFTSACASYYKWVEENEPALFERITQKVKEGKWAVAGGMWVQPDCNIPSGESFARHLLYSQRYFYEKFGKTVGYGYNVDSFGHNGMLPQLLKKAGIDNYVFMRPDNGEKKNIPHLFIWESPDGSSVLTFKIMHGYGEWGANPNKINDIKDYAIKHGHPMMNFYGVGNHGGGPTKRALEELTELMKTDASLKFSSPGEYFDCVNAMNLELKVVSEDLQHHASGCYSAYAPIKEWNRKVENRLISAEKYDVLSTLLTEIKSNRAKIKSGWEKLLFNQFHDILAGCSIKPALEEAVTYSSAAFVEGDETANFAKQRISWNVNTSRGLLDKPSGKTDWILWESDGEGAPVVVFNPHSFPVSHYIQFNRQAINGIKDDEGNIISSQQVRGHQSNGGDCRNTIFPVKIAPFGYATYYLFRQQTFETHNDEELKIGFNFLENSGLFVEFDKETGYISQFINKKEKINYLTNGAVPILIDDEDADTWGHGKFEYNKEVARFGDPLFEIIEKGSLKVTLRVTNTYKNSTLIQDYSLYRGGEELFVKCTLDFHEQFKILKLAFPLNAKETDMDYEIPFGYITKPCNGEEEVGHRYVSINGKTEDGEEISLALINNSKYSFSAVGNEMRMIAARSCGYADHYSDRAVSFEFMTQGLQSFSYSLFPHRKDYAAVAKKALLFNQELEYVVETNHSGNLETKFSAIAISADNIICDTMKFAEGGNDLVLRIYESAGKTTDCEVNLTLPEFEREINLSFGKFEIKTLRINKNGETEEILITEL